MLKYRDFLPEEDQIWHPQVTKHTQAADVDFHHMQLYFATRTMMVGQNIQPNEKGI